MLSRTGTYALQATLYLAAHSNGRAVPTSEIATRLDAPANYLAKVMRRLSRQGLLESIRGAHGGYRLSRPASDITVAEIVEPIDGFDRPKTCLLGGPCDLDDLCSAHERRLEWIEAQRSILRDTTVADLLTNGTPQAAETRSLDS